MRRTGRRSSSPLPAVAAGAAADDRQRVWRWPVRALHWTLVAAMAIAWWTGERALLAHQVAGSVALAAVGLRLLLGFFGDRHERFASFVHAPRATWRYLREVLAAREPRHVGHNPLGGWMVMALLGGVALLGATGWLYTTDAWWGDPRLEAVHLSLAWTWLALATLHVGGVVFTSWRQRENLVAAMFSGRKRAASGDDVD